MNPAYIQLLQRKNLLKPNSRLTDTPSFFNWNQVSSVSQTAPIEQQTAIRKQGFGGHFKDAPPTFINTKTDNKIERLNKPPPKKTKKKKKNKSKK